MSEFDETDFDESEIFDETESLTPEEIFKMVLINKEKGTSVHVELFDEDGDEVELSEIIEKLLTYIEDKISSDEPNQFVDQIMPLMAQSVISGLGRMLGLEHTAFYLTNETSRIALINMMSIAFLLLKFLQKNKITIRTVETDISEEEIEAAIAAFEEDYSPPEKSKRQIRRDKKAHPMYKFRGDDADWPGTWSPGDPI